MRGDGVRPAPSFEESMVPIRIELDDLSGPQIANLLQDHLNHLAAISPPESMHALNLDELRQPNITFWSAWEGEELIGCGALKELDPQHGEIKSMRTAPAHLRKGVASRLLEHILNEAMRRNYRRLSLETGSMKEFDPAQRLYSKFGFRNCGPFANYVEDPNSIFMTREL
jgi:putative acetyltransferase